MFARDKALATLAANVRETAQAFDRLHIKVLCEAINPIDMPGFLINTPQHLNELLTEVRHDNCFAQLDVYHMARQGISVEEALVVLAGKVAACAVPDLQVVVSLGLAALILTLCAGRWSSQAIKVR